MSSNPMKKDSELRDALLVGGLAVIGLPVLLVGLTILYTAVDAFVVVRLWRWFVVEQFALAPLSFWMAAGLLLTVRVLTHKDSGPEREDDRKKEWWSYVVARFLISPPLLLGVGYLVHNFAR